MLLRADADAPLGAVRADCVILSLAMYAGWLAPGSEVGSMGTPLWDLSLRHFPAIRDAKKQIWWPDSSESEYLTRGRLWQEVFTRFSSFQNEWTLRVLSEFHALLIWCYSQETYFSRSHSWWPRRAVEAAWHCKFDCDAHMHAWRVLPACQHTPFIDSPVGADCAIHWFWQTQTPSDNCTNNQPMASCSIWEGVNDLTDSPTS